MNDIIARVAVIVSLTAIIFGVIMLRRGWRILRNNSKLPPKDERRDKK